MELMKEGSTIGPFTLGSVLGQGGMATVFEAHHAVDAHPVALKILRPDIVADPSFIAAFGDEVRAAAKLDHARVTTVYDHGLITNEEAGAATGFAGAPWLAMELVDGGTVSPLAGRLRWSALKSIIIDVLDALAHAHARGLIHRDIKPGNVLLDSTTGRIKLTDFGLAASADFTGDPNGIGRAHFDADHITGTPSYMAPEQIRNIWRDYGPWTDLYAVGAMAWAMAAGQPPYTGKMGSVFNQHLVGDLPHFQSPNPMPPQFVDWIKAMMAVNPDHRFRRAADAAWALSQIRMSEIADDATTIFEHRPPRESDSEYASILDLDTLVLKLDETAHLQLDEQTLVLSEDVSAPDEVEPAEDGPAPMTKLMPPLPSTWTQRRRARIHLHGAGLALFGIRATGVVGREQERDQLWEALKSVKRTQQTHLVLLEGATGTGKTTLAQWFCQRVDEVGGGTWKMSTHTEENGARDGIGPMLFKLLGAAGLDRAGAVEFVAKKLEQMGIPSREDAIGLLEIANPHTDDEDSVGLSAVFTEKQEKFALISRYLRARASQRPFILWLDELHHGPESQDLVAHLLAMETQAPILILGTTSSEAVTAGSDTESTFNRLLAHPHAHKLTLAPLDWAGQVNLMAELLGLEPGLATDVASKCGGNPQFAVQLVGDWVERGLLIPGPEGFELTPGCDVSIPPNLLDVWNGRLAELVSRHPPEALFAIELGAVLGNNVDRGEWTDALEFAGVTASDAMISELLRLRLIIREDALSSWSFVHALFREAVLKHAEEGGRLKRWSSCCADVIREQKMQVARHARLLVGAGRSDEALRPLQDAVLTEVSVGEHGRAKALSELREQILEPLQVDPDGLLALGSRLCALYLVKRGQRTQQTLDEANVLIAWAERLEDWVSVSQLHMRTANEYISLGNTREGETHLNESLLIAKKHRLASQSQILRSMCFFKIRTGDLVQAFNAAREATLQAEQRGDTHGIAKGLAMMARVKWQAGDLDLAEFYLNEAEFRHIRIGYRRGLAEVWNTRGELARARHDLKTAEHAYREAVDRYESCGSVSAVFAKLNLGTTYVSAEKYVEAESLLDEMDAFLTKVPRPVIAELVGLLRAICRIHFLDWEAVAKGLVEVKQKIEELGLVDVDFATTARTAAVACESGGRPDLATVAWALARDQFEALGRGDEAAEAAERLAQ